MMELTHLINLLVQVLSTKKGSQLKASQSKKGKLKGGQVFPYCPLFTGISYQLKRYKLWNNLEVHAIYALVYLLCTNKNGIIEFKKYLSAKDPQVFDPHFIAQYLLVPINTIVKFCLLPWMMIEYEELNLSDNENENNKYRSRCTKAAIFLDTHCF